MRGATPSQERSAQTGEELAGAREAPGSRASQERDQLRDGHAIRMTEKRGREDQNKDDSNQNSAPLSPQSVY